MLVGGDGPTVLDRALAFGDGWLPNYRGDDANFDRVAESSIERGARHPRGNSRWPRVGIFAQRAKDRPNRLGSTVVEIVKRDDRVLTVAGLDAVDGTPVLDIKPVMMEFLPRTTVRQPAWSHELMRQYWKAGEADRV